MRDDRQTRILRIITSDRGCGSAPLGIAPAASLSSNSRTIGALSCDSLTVPRPVGAIVRGCGDNPKAAELLRASGPPRRASRVRPEIASRSCATSTMIPIVRLFASACRRRRTKRQSAFCRPSRKCASRLNRKLTAKPHWRAWPLPNASGRAFVAPSKGDTAA